MRAGIALGANLGERLLNLTTGRALLFALPGAEAPFLSSAIYETEPVDCEPEAQLFLNAVVEMEYRGSARELLSAMREIEATLGRPVDHARNRSRSIDLDLLYHGPCAIDEADLQLPHPRLHLRGFVLQPLAEIRPSLLLPGQTQTARALADGLARRPLVVHSARQW